MLTGPLVNAAALVVGGVVGAVFGRFIPERVRTALPAIFGLSSMALGIMLIIKVKFMTPVVLALILGTVIGEAVYIENVINKTAHAMRALVDRIFPANNHISHERFIKDFVALLILFSFSGTGIFGAMHEGMTGDPSILYIKTMLDLFTAMIFAATLGMSVITITVPMLVVQVGLAMLANVLLPIITPDMMADFSTTGGVILLATGLRICGIKLFAVANMIPALVLAMPFSYLWAYFMT